MKIGDLVRHYDGDKGIVIGYAPSSSYPYRVWFFTNKRTANYDLVSHTDWFIKKVFKVISESR